MDNIQTFDKEQLYQSFQDLVSNKLQSTSFSEFSKEVDKLLTSLPDTNDKHIALFSFYGSVNSILDFSFVKAVKEKYPDHKIHLFIDNNSSLLWENCPYIEETIPVQIDNSNILTVLISAIELAKQYTWNYKFDLAFLPYNEINSIFLAWIIGTQKIISIKESVDDEFSSLIDEKIEFTGTNELERRFALIKEPVKLIDKLWFDFSAIDQSIKDTVIVDISSLLPNQEYSIKNYAKILLSLNKNVIIIGNNENALYLQSLLTDNIYSLDTNLPKLNKDRVNIASEKTLTQFYLISQASLFIGNDNGLSHLAALYKVPTLVLLAEAEEKQDEKAYSAYYRYHDSIYGDKYIALRPEYCAGNCFAIKSYGGCSYHMPHCINEITIEQIEDALTKLNL